MLAVIVSSSRCCGGRDSLDRIDQFGGRQDFMCVGRAIDVERGMIGFRRPGSRAVANERDVKAEFHADARRGLKAGVGEQAHANDLLLAVCLSWCSRSVFGKPLDAQCSVTTMSPSCT